MRILSFITIATLAGCGLKRMLPQEAVIDDNERSAIWGTARPSGATYTSPSQFSVPVSPIIGWGVAYDLDLVIVSRHPDWDMHEYAMVKTPNGPVWLAKDARADTLDQSIVADIEQIDTWLPEIPVIRKSWPLVVKDNSTDTDLDISLRYQNLDGKEVALTYQGQRPTSQMKKRNGSTMGHSAGQVMAVLDLSHRDFGRRVEVVIGGENYKPESILRIKPFFMALQQVQAGFAIGHKRIRSDKEQVIMTHLMPSGAEVEEPWSIHVDGEFTVLTQSTDFRKIEHRFLSVGEAQELSSITIHQFGRETPTMEAHFNPALPDSTIAFSGTVTSRFVLDVNGQKSHGVGSITSSWQNNTATYQLSPKSPWWLADRPMTSTVTINGNEAVLETHRIP